jgi:hypothetical protein
MYDDMQVLNFRSSFKIPFAGYRGSNQFYDQGSWAYLWSSSPMMSWAYILEVRAGEVSFNWPARVRNASVRCFKNEPVDISTYINFRLVDLSANSSGSE